MIKIKKKKKQTRRITDTEYHGYKRNHPSVENAVEREDFKAKNSQSDSIKQRKNTKQKIDYTLRSGNVDIIEEFEFESQKAERKMRGAHGRIKRKKLIDGYEENKKSPGHS